MKVFLFTENILWNNTLTVPLMTTNKHNETEKIGAPKNYTNLLNIYLLTALK